MPEISVIVPVYNAETCIRRCVDSILAQTYADLELILVDDGSPDGSPAICDEYAQKDPRIRTFHLENGGQASARNFGVRMSVAEWICFVDSDDLIHPQMLELLYFAAGEAHCKLAMCGACEAESVPEDFCDRQVASWEKMHMDEAGLLKLKAVGRHRFWTVWGKLMHRSIVESLPFMEGRIYEDNAIVPQWLYLAQDVVNVEEELYFYQINKNGTTKGPFSASKKQLDYLWALETLLSFFKMHHMRMIENRINGQYVVALADLYAKYQAFSDGAQIAASLKRKYFHFKWKHLLQHIPVNHYERDRIMSVFYPHIYGLKNRLK